MSKSAILAIFAVAVLVGGSAAAYIYVTSDEKTVNEESVAEEGYPRTVRDFYGHEFTLNQSPKRVVAMSMEYLVYMGQDVVDRVIWAPKSRGAMSADPHYQIFDLSEVATAEGSMISMAEQIMAKNPDLVLMGDSRTNEKTRENFRETLNSAGINVFFYTNQSNLFSNSKECIEVNLIPISKIFNKEDRALELYDFITSLTDGLYERLSKVTVEEKKNAYVAGGAGKQRPNFLGSSANTYFPIMYLDDYVHNVMKDIAPDVEHMDMETFEKLYNQENTKGNIDYIFVSQSCWDGEKGLKALWGADKTKFQALEAFKTGNVFFVMDWFPRATNPLICAYMMAAQMFPEQFEDFDAKQFAIDMFETFYGVEGSGLKSYNYIVDNINKQTGQDIPMFGKIDLAKL